MNSIEAKEEIRLIREMIEKTKRVAAKLWSFFFFWGILIIIAIMGMYLLVVLKRYGWIWLNWIFFTVIGVIYSMVYWARQEKLEGTKTYAQIAMAHLSFACGIAFLLTGLVLPALGVYSYGVIPILIAVIAGVFIFVIGGIYEWNLVKWLALIWWFGALGMVFLHAYYRTLFCVPLIIVGYLLPGCIFRSRYRKSLAKNAS